MVARSGGGTRTGGKEGGGRWVPAAREEEEKVKGSGGDAVSPFQSGMAGI
jgi:hypothetical protein